MTSEHQLSEDLTKTKRADADYLSRQEVLKTIFDRVPVLIAFANEVGTISLVNRYFERTSGWSVEDARTRNLVTELFADQAETKRFFAFIRASPNDWAPFRMRTKDGAWIDISWSSVLLHDGTRIGIGLDITERNRTEAERGILDEELFASRELLEVLSRRLIDAQEEERRHLAHELHDEIGQVLTTVHLNLEFLRSKIDPTALGRLEDSLKVVNTAIDQIRTMSLDLRPASLDMLGLDATLRGFLKRQATRAGLVVEFTSDLAGERFPALVEIVCFRIVQEALTNVFRHARATHCWIELTRTAGRIQIVIRDNGRGFDPVAAKKRALGGESFGLLGMLERVQLYSGEMSIDSAPDHGTIIRASFPLATPAERAELERAS